MSRFSMPNHRPYLVGSSNGLVCIISAQVLVANPCTREVKKLQIPEFRNRVASSCWGFGYDSRTDDYKIIRGVFLKGGVRRSSFRVSNLKSNIWRNIGPVLKYYFISSVGVLWNGALYWLMGDAENKKDVIILSFDLSKEEFKKIPQPDDDIYRSCMDDDDDDDISFSFGVIKEGLCIYESQLSPSSKKWVMKNDNEWKLMKRDMEESDVIHYLTPMKDYVPQKSFLSHEDVCSSKSGAHIGSPLFVQSLVSPHGNVIVKEKPPKRIRQTSEDDNPRSVKLNKR